jgi:hypothetical protein
MSTIEIKHETPELIAFEYATVREQRHAIETAIRVLNETASQATKAQVKAGDHFMAIRNLLDEKDSQLQEREYVLYSKIKR